MGIDDDGDAVPPDVAAEEAAPDLAGDAMTLDEALALRGSGWGAGIGAARRRDHPDR